MKYTRFTSGVLTALLFASMLTSCGGTSEETETTAAAVETTPVETETETRFMPDDLPTLDFGGAATTILVGDYANAYWGDFYAEEVNGNRINDTLFDMKNSMNERLNIDLGFVQKTFDYNGRIAYMNEVIQVILAGADDYDIQVCYNFIAQQAEGKYFLNLNESQYIDFDKPWWNSTVIDVMPSENIHFATGDGTLAAIKHTFAVFVNQELLTAGGVTEDLFALVESGEWTLDKLTEYASLFYADTNGNGEKDFEDTYGLTFNDTNKYLGFISALGVDEFVKGSSGYEVTFGNERSIDVVTRLCSIINDSDYAYPGYGNADHPEMIPTGGGNYATKVFMEGRSVFNCGLVQDASTMIPELDFTCSILPYPKWAAEEEYKGMLQRNAYFTIPASCKDFDLSGAVLEAWSSLAYRQLQPEYFEVAMKARYSESEGSARMFDIIRESLYFDIGEIFAEVVGAPSAAWRNDYLVKNNTNWASYVAKNQEKWKTMLDEMYEALQ